MLSRKNILMNLNSKGILEQLLHFRHTSKIAVDLDKELVRKLEAEEIKPRQHPGICKIKIESVPENILKGIVRCIGDHPVKSVLRDSYELARRLKSRHPPADPGFIKAKLKDIEQQVDMKHPPPVDIEKSSEEVITNYRNLRSERINKILKERVISWKPISFGYYEGLLYAVGRGAAEYAILSKIFNEIKRRDASFVPRSFCDFGSGVGTGMWAVSQLWKDSLYEYFNIDSSRDMNDLSEMILREGKDNHAMMLKNVYYRQFLPADEKTKYNIVLSAFSLFELSNAQTRLETVRKLWNKCDNYLVIIEQGTRHGFKLVNEARDYILSLSDHKERGAENVAHIFSPCPHELDCPRLQHDKTPCNFSIKYQAMPIGDNLRFTTRTDLYSYVVIKRKLRNIEDETENWPRLVRPTLVRSKHSICRMCTEQGKLQEAIFTQSKHGKFVYRCARSSRWGDRLPLKLGEPIKKDVKVEEVKIEQ